MSVAFPLPPVWRQERHTSGGWKGLRDDLTYAISCPGRQPVRQLPFALVLDLLNRVENPLHVQLDSVP
jgi:hypothetical protein